MEISAEQFYQLLGGEPKHDKEKKRGEYTAVSYTHLDVYKRQVLNSYGISSIEEAEKITKDAGLDVYDKVKKIQPICFETACWAYTIGAAIAIKKGCKTAADAAAATVSYTHLDVYKRQQMDTGCSYGST